MVAAAQEALPIDPPEQWGLFRRAYIALRERQSWLEHRVVSLEMENERLRQALANKSKGKG